MLHSFNVDLWAEYTFLFVLLTLLLPCFWVAYIWEEIIDPHYESESIPEPEHRILRFFYSISGPITRSLGIRTLIYIIISCLFVTTAVTDVVSNSQCCRMVNLRHKGKKNIDFWILFKFQSFFFSTTIIHFINFWQFLRIIWSKLWFLA